MRSGTKSSATRIWTAAQLSPQSRSGRYTLVGRVAEGMSVEQMDGPLGAIASTLRANFLYPDPQWDRTRTPSITPAREFFVGDVRPSLIATLAAMGAILLIACANVAALMSNLRAIDPGLHLEGLVVVDATMPTRLTAAERRRAITEVIPSLQALPGVRSVGAAQKLPLRGSGDNWGIEIRGKPDLQQATTAFRMVTHEYFSTLGVPLRRGRTFGPSDRDGSERVVMINEALAARFFPGEDPVGRVLVTFDDQGERIIGVVDNVAEAKLTDAPVPARYMLYEHVPPVWHQVSFVLRTDAPDQVPVLLDAARSTIAREGGQLAVQEMTTMANLFELAMGPAAQVVTLLSLLAGLALVLGAVGVYGVISHYVGRRSRDYGIRIALGQQPSRVIRQVVGRGAALVAVGSAIGIAAAVGLTRVLSTMLYGVQATDPLALAAAVALLLLVGMLAAFIPARRASLTDPAQVLRQ